MRVNASGTGWIVARLPFDRTAEARDRRRRRAQGRTKPASIPLQLNCGSGFGTDRESAIEKLKHSQHWHGTLAVVLDQPWRLAPSAASRRARSPGDPLNGPRQHGQLSSLPGGPPFFRFIGLAEVLALAGLTLPTSTGILPWLTPLAAAGLLVIMLGAAILHLRRAAYAPAVVDTLILAFITVVVYLTL